MNLKYKKYEYYRFRRSVIFLAVVLVADFLLCLGLHAWETDEKFLFVLLGISLALLVLFVLGRRFLIGALAVTDLDFKTLYEIDKRRSDKAKDLFLNSARLGDCLFYDGHFSEASVQYASALKYTEKEKNIYAIRHMLILSLFLSENTGDIQALIDQQRNAAMAGTKNKYIQGEAKYYDFIEFFLKGDYNGAVIALQPLLNDESLKILNARRVTVNYLLSLAFGWLGNAEAVAHCKSQVLEADKNRKTVFSYFCSK